ncbi:MULTISPECIES: aminotransferase-like domain-containing protein [Providencia]|uniref:aminotransferase-like domain-containing protein n=1 Tax=Providencia TaxID=586 RepID=UPI00083824FD|nr:MULTISPECIES: PLP-dependent aminotransferase family protein [Providencia]MBP6121337.1 PLP-dependent aminotransferase family protein [Providencia sp.]NIH22774.1 PLP-dependent aminotransferase family protein [Providencia heimbachae]
MGQPRYKQYIDRIGEKIRSGALAPGTQLPTHRELAKQEKLSLVTASRIYRELIELGLVSGEIGRGTFVRDINLLPTLSIEQDVTTEMLDLNFSYPIAKEQTALLRGSLRKLSAGGDLEGLLYYQQHKGRHHERTIVAQYLISQGLKHSSADSTVLVSGAQHGLATIVLGMFNPGDTIAVDALTYPGFKALAATYAINLLPISVLENGPNLTALEKGCKQNKVRAYFTMPTLHNPLGWVMNLTSRKSLISLARKHQFFLIEDGSYAFLHRQAPPPLASLAPDITFYTTGFSKNIATGLRVGAVVAPIQYIENIERIIRITTWNTPALTTAIVCDWIENGHVTRIERDKRRDAKARQEIVKQILGDLEYRSHPSSYFIWLPLPEGVRLDTVMSQLNRQHIAVSSAESFSTSPIVPPAIRVAISTLGFDELRVALRTIKSVVEYSIDLS